MTSRRSDNRQLIIQLARFGDLLQLAPLTAELGAASELHLLVDSTLETTARLLPKVAKIIPIPRTDALKLVLQDNLDGGRSFWTDVAVTLQAERYDRVINVTHTPESGLIARLTGCEDIRGATYDRKGLTSLDPWERLFRATLSRRDWNSFHLVDLHRLSAGIVSTTERSTFNFQLSTFNSPKGIALQLGANSPLRRWPVDSFVKLARIVHNVHPVHFTLLGSAEESELAAEFLRLSSLPARDLTGKTTPSQLADVLKECDLLVSGDTGTIHLAALVGTQTVGIYFGMARPDDTAPYQPGAVVFEPRASCYPCGEHNRCSHLSCHRDVPVEAVAGTVLDLLAGDAIIPKDTPSFRCRIVAFDKHGFTDVEGTKSPHSIEGGVGGVVRSTHPSANPISLLSLSSAAVTASDHRHAAMRNLWLAEFAGASLQPASSLDPEHADELAPLVALSTTAASDARNFRLSFERGSPDRDLLKQIQQQMKRIESFSSSSGPAGLLAQMFSIEIERPQSDSVGAIHLIESSLSALSRRCQLLAPDIPLNSQLSTLNYRIGVA